MNVNGTEKSLDAAPYCDGNTVMVPAKNLLSSLELGVIENTKGVYTVKRDDGKYFTVTEGNTAAVVNGENYNLGIAPYKKDGVVLMIPLDIISETFGVSVRKEWRAYEEGIIYITYNYTGVKTETLSDGMLSANADCYDITYSLSGISGTDDVEVQWRLNGNKTYDAGAYYHLAPNPEYRGSSYCGAFSVPYPNARYDVRVIVSGQGNTRVYEKLNAVKTNSLPNLSYNEFVATETEKVVVRTTYENLSYYYTSNAALCEVYYRESGKSEWKKAYEPYCDEYAENQQFRGSIVGLKSDTLYEVKCIGKDKNGNKISEKVGTGRTLNNNPTIARTINLKDIYNGGELLLSGLNGSADGWIKVVDDGTTPIYAGEGYSEAVMLDRCSYLILEGIQIRGGVRNGIKISSQCDNIRISDCDISEWGRRGFLDEEKGLYYIDGEAPNNDAAVDIRNSGFVTVENCYIHKPRGTANYWNGASWRGVHPCGPTGIYYMYNKGVVIRNNEIIGDGEHLFNDGTEGGSNANIGGGPSADSDIYGNIFAFGTDDAIELDGSQMNVRFYGNKITNFFCGVSIAPNMAGPSYIYRNVITDLYFDNVQAGSAIKAGGDGNSGIFGTTYLFHNTMDNIGHGLRNVNGEFHAVTRNNIFVSESYRALANDYANSRDSFDYDVVGGKHKLPAGSEKNGFYANPVYVDKKGGNLKLKEDSPGKGAAVYLDNFNEVYGADIGAF